MGKVAASAAPQAEIVRPFGFNVIGYVSGNLGLGVAARNVSDLVLQNGFDMAVYDLDPGIGRGKHDRRFERFSVDRIEQLPYAINLFVLPAPTLAVIVREDSGYLSSGGYLNAAMIFWELPLLPTQWIPAHDAMDVIVAASQSIRCMFQFALSGPMIIEGLLPLQLPSGISPNRSRFGLPEDAVIFGLSFETNSDAERKNPWAAIDAFLQGAGHMAAAHLVIKVNNATIENGVHPVLAQIAQRSGGHPRIHVLTDVLSYADVLSLYASCDVYVSLHRAEGLGLGLMESMALGKPVIATAWSGNMTFMNHTNSCLVSYELVPVAGSVSTYSSALLGEGAHWAEPCVAEAAAWMRKLVEDAVLRTAVGARAAADMARMQSEAKNGRMLKEIEAIWRSRSFLPRRVASTSKPRHFQQIISDRDRTISELESDLRWITSKRSYRAAKAITDFFKGRTGDKAE